MAIYLTLDKRQSAPSGLIPLRRGDDWKLKGQIVEKYARYSAPLDMTSCSATASFAGDPSGIVTAVVSITDSVAGLVEIDVAASASPGVLVSENGTNIYMVMNHPTRGVITVESELPNLEIKDRGFSEP